MFVRKSKFLFSLLSGVVAGVLAFTLTVGTTIPDRFSVVEGENFSIESGIPVDVQPSVVSADSVEASVATAGHSYKVDLKLLGLFPVKQVTVDVVKGTTVIPCGTPFGIKMFTDGVLIIGMSTVDTEAGSVNPAKDAGLELGDVIVSIDGKGVMSNEDVSKIISQCDGSPLVLSVRRDNMTFDVSFTPAFSKSDGCYKLGAWVRDSSAGIGTLTFYEPESMVFGGLGHGICDMDTGEILPLMSGEIVPAVIGGINPGKVGQPGELRGSFSSDKDMGVLTQNGETGVYGILDTAPSAHEPMQVAMRQQVQEGSAQILTTIDGETPQYYDITIEKVNFNDNSPTKNMVIRITDQELLDKAGGIVQGMSGSPIIQNGMLVGAVTHVFVNDPTRGYGIFAENMLDSAKQVDTSVLDKAS